MVCRQYLKIIGYIKVKRINFTGISNLRLSSKGKIKRLVNANRRTSLMQQNSALAKIYDVVVRAGVHIFLVFSET